MAFDDNLKERVRDASDLVKIIGARVPLKKRGSSYLGLCPFHPDRNPSFNVHPRRQFYKCWSCGKGGDVFTFLMEYDHLSFPEALRELAHQAGIPVPEGPGRAAASREKDRLLPLREMNGRAADIYHEYLLRAAGAEAARDYVRSRKFQKDWIRKWKLGYAPEDWHFLPRAFSHHWNEEVARAAGLVSHKEGHSFDFFRDRLLFPIQNERGEVLGFGGRSIRTGQEPKYLNTGETPLFLKKKNLYGLHQALPLLGKEKAVWIVEGYLDVIACQTAGVPALAPLGTAFTEEQLQKVRRYGERIVFCFDGDSAGRRAAERSAALAVQAGGIASVLLLPEGQDPFDLLQKHGPEALATLLRTPGQDVYAYYLDCLIPEGMRSPGETARLAKIVTDFLPGIRDETVRHEFQKMAAERLAMDLSILRKNPPVSPPRPSQIPARSEDDAGIRNLEQGFLIVLCRHPSHLRTAGGFVRPEDLTGRDTRWLYEHLLLLPDKPHPNLADVLEVIPSEKARDWVTRKVLEAEEEDTDDSADNPEGYVDPRLVEQRLVMDWLMTLKRSVLKRQMAELQRQVLTAAAEAQESRVAELQNEIMRLRSEMDHLRQTLSN